MGFPRFKLPAGALTYDVFGFWLKYNEAIFAVFYTPTAYTFMSAIITGVLDLTFGLLWDKLRDHTAERLQHGDVTDEKCREIIVRELDDINSILDSLSRKDLLASISFLKEGVCLLNTAFSPDTDYLEKSALTELRDKSGNECQNSKSKQNLYAFKGDIKQLSQIIAHLPIVSKDRLSCARMSFADARREATKAFNNKALSTKDRVLACKLRVLSRMLESFEDPRAVVETCMLYLVELHNLEAVQEIFNVHINGGLKSLFNKQKRQELMSSVIMVSYELANFILSFAEKKYNLLTWPKVEISRGHLHPLLDPAANAIMHNAKIGAPNMFVFERMHFSEITQHGCNIIREIMTTGNGHIAEIIIEDGVMQFRMFYSTDEINTVCAKILLFVTSDEQDNIFAVIYIDISAGDAKEFDFLLLVADKAANLQFEEKLSFLARAEKEYRESASSDLIEEIFLNSPTHVEFAVNTAGKILIFGHQNFLYICDGNGVLSHHFETADQNDLVCITRGDIITAAYFSSTVYVYALDGSMIHQFDTVRGQVICDVALRHYLNMIYVLTRNYQGGESQLETYTDLGEHQGNLKLPSFSFSALLALREGPVAVIYDKGFILT